MLVNDFLFTSPTIAKTSIPIGIANEYPKPITKNITIYNRNKASTKTLITRSTSKDASIATINTRFSKSPCGDNPSTKLKT